MVFSADLDLAGEPSGRSLPSTLPPPSLALPPAESAGAESLAEPVTAPAPWPTLPELDRAASTQQLLQREPSTPNPMLTHANSTTAETTSPATAMQAAAGASPPPPPPAGALALNIDPVKPARAIFLTVDQMLELHVGQFGLGQLVMLTIASIAFIPNGLMMLLMIFVSADPIQSHKWRCTSAEDAACVEVWNNEHVDRVAFCALTAEQYEWTAPNDSLVSQYGLVCGKAWQSTLVNALYFLGLAAGGTVFGAICDRYGRRVALYLCMLLGVITTALSTVGGSFWQYAVWRTLNAVTVQGMTTAIIVWSTEPVGSLYRGAVGIVSQALFVGGEMLLALLAYLIPDWKKLSLTCAAISATYLITILASKESPRWLAMRGREEKAMAVLNSLAALNKHEIPAGVRLRCDDVLAPHPHATAHHHHHGPAAVIGKLDSAAPRASRSASGTKGLDGVTARSDSGSKAVGSDRLVKATGAVEASRFSGTGVRESVGGAFRAPSVARDSVDSVEQRGQQRQKEPKELALTIPVIAEAGGAAQGAQSHEGEERDESSPLLWGSAAGFVHTPSHTAATPFAGLALQAQRSLPSPASTGALAPTGRAPTSTLTLAAASGALTTAGSGRITTPSESGARASPAPAAGPASERLPLLARVLSSTASGHPPARSESGIRPGTPPGPGRAPTDRSALLVRVLSSALSSASALARQISSAASDDGPEALTPFEALSHRPILVTFATLSFTLCALVMSYYGSSFGLAGFGGNPYLNFFLFALAELPSYVVAALVVDRGGRVPLMVVGLLLSGVACILCGFATSWASVVLAMIGKFGASAAWAALSVYASEVFPTSVRSILSGSVNIFGRIGGFATPILFQWSASAASSGGSAAFIIHAFPYWLMGAWALVASVLVVLLPETAQAHQPDSAKEFEQLMSHGNFITHSIKRWRHRREHGDTLGPDSLVSQHQHVDHPADKHLMWAHMRASVRDSFRHMQEHMPHPHLPHLPHLSDLRESFRHMPHPHLPHLPHLPLHPLATFRTWRNNVWHTLGHEEEHPTAAAAAPQAQS